MNHSEQLSTDALLRILGSLYPNGDQLLSSFLCGMPVAPHWQRRIGDSTCMAPPPVRDPN